MPAKYLTVRVLKNREEIININVPVNLIDVVKKAIPQKELKKHEIDVDAILSMVKNGLPPGKIVDIKDKSGTEVEISLK